MQHSFRRLRRFPDFSGFAQRALAALAIIAVLGGVPTASRAQSSEVDVMGAPGHWLWTGRTYVWIEGRRFPPPRDYQYIPAHWERVRGAWLFVPARWVFRPY
jgi:hypothetical protein